MSSALKMNLMSFFIVGFEFIKSSVIVREHFITVKTYLADEKLNSSDPTLVVNK